MNRRIGVLAVALALGLSASTVLGQVVTYPYYSAASPFTYYSYSPAVTTWSAPGAVAYRSYYAPYSVPPTTYSVPPTTYSVPPTTYSVPPTTYSVPPTTYSMPPTTYSVPATNYSVPATTYYSTYRPWTTYGYTSYYAAPYTSYSAPAYTYGTYAPIVTYSAARPVIVGSNVYVPGQPVRNAVRNLW